MRNIVIVLILIITGIVIYYAENHRQSFTKVFVISNHKFANGKTETGLKPDHFLKILEQEDCWFEKYYNERRKDMMGSRFVCVSNNRIFVASSKEISEQRRLKNHVKEMSKEDFAERSAIVAMGYDAYCEAFTDSKFCTKNKKETS